MVRLYVRTIAWIQARWGLPSGPTARRGRLLGSFCREEGQTTAEYALVILAAAAVALVLIGWAQSSGKLPAFFDKVIDDITGNF
jgi:Flp pilus assembly pilin Flp